MVLLSKFATKAKKHIGMVELNKMFSSPRYANNIFIKARLSEDKELAILTKIVNQELNLNAIEISSIEAYLDSLNPDTSLEHLESSKYFLIILADYLYAIPANGKAYRQAVDSMIQHADVEERHLCLQLARAFYPFWLKEHQLVAEIQSKTLSKPIHNENEALKKITSEQWNTIDTELFSSVETVPIDLYVTSLHFKGTSSEQIHTKQKLAKLIIKELRNEQNDTQSYRKVIEKTQHIFSRQDLQQFFLQMSRDFYSFWTATQQID